MTKLSTHIPLEYVKQNKKLQEIKPVNYWNETIPGILINERFRRTGDSLIPAPTIADIIDSNLIRNADKREILDECIADWGIEEVSKYIIDNIK